MKDEIDVRPWKKFDRVFPKKLDWVDRMQNASCMNHEYRYVKHVISEEHEHAVDIIRKEGIGI